MNLGVRFNHRADLQAFNVNIPTIDICDLRSVRHYEFWFIERH